MNDSKDNCIENIRVTSFNVHAFMQITTLNVHAFMQITTLNVHAFMLSASVAKSL